MGVEIGMALTLSPVPVSTLWPPNAILFAVLLLTPTRWWWLIIVGVLPVHIAAELSSGVPLVMVLCWFVSNVCEALIGALGIRRFTQGPILLDSSRQLAVYLFFAFLAPFLSSFLDAAFVILVGNGQNDYWVVVGARFPSNALAMLTVAPVVLSIGSISMEELRRVSLRRYAELGVLTAVLLILASLVFHLRTPHSSITFVLLYILTPPLIWAALRFDTRIVSALIFAVALIAIEAAVNGSGPFAAGTVLDNARAVQLFLITAAVPILALVAVTQERARGEQHEQDQREQLAHLGRVSVMGELSGALAHELNQPLTAIMSNAQAARRSLDHARIDVDALRETLEDIIEEDRRASAVISHMRDLLKRGRVEYEAVDVNEIVGMVLALGRSDLLSCKVSLELNLAAGMPAVNADRVQLQQVLLNLIANARDAMAGNPPTDRVISVATRQAPDEKIEILIRDRGQGIPEDQRSKVFDAFYSSKPHGLGFGLAICRTIVTAHHGRLSFTSNTGRGTTFHVSLPIYRL